MGQFYTVEAEYSMDYTTIDWFEPLVPLPSPAPVCAPVLGFVSDTPDKFYGAAMRYYGKR